jgi:starch-binding outer membrane protein, SusD/RagB family
MIMKPFRLFFALAVSVFLVGVVAACDKALEVEAPSRIPAAGLEDPANAQILLNGAISDFDCAFGAYTVVGGLIGDELEDATQTADRYPYDRRTITPADIRYQTSECTAIGVYTPLQRARVSSDNIRRLLEGWTDAQVSDRQTKLATAVAYEAYAMLLFGEGFCATAFSHFNPDGTVTYGTEITAQQALDSAIGRFDQAIQVATAAGAGAQNILNLSRAGRARAKLDRGDLAGARADAVLVPAAFQYNVTASATPARRTNRVWADNGKGGGGSINSGSSVGTRYRTLNDPRVPVENTGQTAAGTRVPIWVQTKYAGGGDPLPLATGDEARLIVAEADITANPANALLIINEYRARGNETPLVAPTAAQLRAALIEERRRELFLESQHLGDLIRYQEPLSPAAGTTFPGGGQYGTQRCMPLPDVERLNNPTLTS